MSTESAWFAVDRETDILHGLDEKGEPVCGIPLTRHIFAISRVMDDKYNCCQDCMVALARKPA